MSGFAWQPLLPGGAQLQGMGTSVYGDLLVTDGAVVAIPLGEASGTSAADYVGGTAWTYRETPTFGTAGAIAGEPSTTGTSFAAASYENAYIDAVPLNATDNFTLEAWVKPSGLTGNSTIISCGGGTSGFQLWVQSGVPRGLTYGAGMCDGGTSLTDGVWQLVHMRRESGITSVWINGVQADPGTNNTTASNTPITRSAIGCYDNGNYFFNGAIQWAALYDTALSDAILLAHYNAGVAVVTTGTVTLTLIDRTGTVYSLTRIDQVVTLGLLDQTGTVFSLAGISQNVVLGIIDQTGAVFGPSVVQVVAPALIDSSGSVFSLTSINTVVTAAMTFIDQTGAAYGIAVVPGSVTVAPALIDSTGSVFSLVRIDQSVALGIIDQTGTVVSITVTGGDPGVGGNPSDDDIINWLLVGVPL